jgi:DNA-directed RNA polymerase beta' subunit
VDYNTELVIRWNGHVHAVRNGSVGMLIDSLMESHSAQIQTPEPNTEYLSISDGLAEALTVDEHGNVTWETLEAVTRHPPVNKDGTNTLVRVKTKSGRSVTATKAKSFLVVKEGRIETKDGASIQVGDMIPVIQTLPTSLGFTALEVKNYLSPTEYIFTNITSKIDMSQRSWFDQYKNDVPYERSDTCRAAIEREPRFRTTGLVFPKHIRPSTRPIPDILELNRDSGFFFGAYLAEGCATPHQIHIAKNDVNYREKAAVWPTSMGLCSHVTAPKECNGGISTTFHSTVLARLMVTLCNHGSWVKKVPSFAFSAPRDFVEGLLDAYFSGDGSVAKNGAMSCTSRSKILTEGISLLLKNYGIRSTIMTWNVNEKPVWSLYISIAGGQTFMQHIQLTTPAKRLEDASVQPRTAEVLNDVFLDEVVSVEEVPSSHPFVYDLTVAKTRNMVTASGLCCRDTFHNAGNSAKNVTLGVPRFEELINASSKIKTPSITVFADATLRPEKAWKIKTEIQRIRIQDLASVHSIAPMTSTPQLQEYLKCPDNQQWDISQKGNIFKCILSRKKMVQNDVCTNNIISTLRKTKKYAIAYHDNLVDDVHIYMQCRNDFFKHAKNILDTTIKGSQHIHKVEIRTEGKHFVVDTEGIDLDFLKTLQSIDQTRTQCNDIFAIKAAYGIEAARAALLHEMHTVLSFDGSYVNIRHLMVIIDWMTWTGHPTALTRHGVKKMMDDTTPLKRATFEQPVEIFHHAAVKGLHDKLAGISEQLLIGKFPKCGSHYNEVITEKSYQKLWEEDTWLPPVEKDDDLFGDWTGQSTWNTQNTFATVPFANSPQQLSAHAWQQAPAQPAWQQSQAPAQHTDFIVQSPNYAPAWQQAQAPAHPDFIVQSPVPSAGRKKQKIDSPAYSPTSPAYSPTSPAYSPTSPAIPTAYSPTAYSPTAYSPTSPAYSPTSPAYSPTSPAYSPTAYSPTSPAYSPTAYSPTSPAYSPTAYSPTAYSPTSPKSPAYSPTAYSPTSSASPASSLKRHIVDTVTDHDLKKQKY